MDQKHERRTGADPTTILLCCSLFCCCTTHKKKQSRRSQEQSEAAGAQIHSQHRSLAAKHLTPLEQPSCRLQPTGLPAEPSLVSPSPSRTRLRSKAKPILNATSGCCPSAILLFSFLFYFFPFCVLAPLLLQNGKSSTAGLAYKRRLCSDWTPCYRRALCRT